MALDDFDSIDSIRSSEVKTFREEFFRNSRPVVIKGLWDNYPARRKWTVDYFKDGFGKLKPNVFKSGCEWPESRKCHTMFFGDYLDILSADELNPMFIDAWNIFRHRKEMKRDFEKTSLIEKYLQWAASMFFGCKSASSPLRQNPEPVQTFHTQLFGEKQVILIPPKYSDLLYKLPLESESLANFENINYFKFPGLQIIKCKKFTLEPGDTLFVPAGYWHQVRYFDGGYAVSQRNIPTNLVEMASGIWKEDIIPLIDKGLHKTLGSTWEKYKIEKSRKKTNKEYYQISVERKFKNILPADEKEAVTSKYTD